MAQRRGRGEGSVYQRSSDGLWVATIELDGVTAAGKRRRVTVSAKTRTAVLKKVRDKRVAIAESGAPTQDARTTVGQWAQAWLTIKQKELSPRGFNAAASPVRRWIIPTIGHRRLTALTPTDLRAVADAQRAAGRKGSTAAATHRTLLNLLRAAIVEGHQVPQRVLLVKAPKMSVSDRMDVPLADAVKCLTIAATLPHGTRWALALIFGVRQGEALGLTWDCVDFDRDEIRIEWQLDNLPYVDRKRKHLGFRVPLEYECRHLVDSWHLVRPKSKSGHRVLPMSPSWRQAMLDWQVMAPDNPWGLVYPSITGRPANDRNDLSEWHALQCTAEVGHPAGRYFHVHECRNAAATQLADAGADDKTRQELLGHATLAQSDAYRRIHREPKLRALELVSEAFQWGPPTG